MTASNNAHFKFDDARISSLGGTVFPPDWWSRPYEYAWALGFACQDDVAADMGCGWMGRPMTAELARRSKEVYGIDADERVHGLDKHKNLYYLTMDFTSSEMDYFEADVFDKIYCISVIEDLSPGDRLEALKNFRRTLKPDGKIVITMDVAWESFRISKPYPTVNVNHFIKEVDRAGLQFVGRVDAEMPANAVHQPEWNLACFHALLERK